MKRTQCDRVLTLARRFCGICQAELYDAPDKRGPITRLAARIQDLEDAGHVFEILRDRKGTRTYRWVEGPDTREPGAHTHAGSALREGERPPVAVLGPEAQESLFPVPAVPHYRQDAA